MNIDHLQQWVGRSQRMESTVTPAPIRALAATLDLSLAEALTSQPLRPCWHWLYFLPAEPQSAMGDDGHPRRGGFLPPVPLPRRMWAGSHIEFLRPITTGQAIARTSRIDRVSLKEGRTGPLVFVKLIHEIEADGKTCVREAQDIVYREMPAPGGATSERTLAPPVSEWAREIHPSEVLLFRYSALTFNAHRIHYDRRYAIQVEGYPGLVVHGPLLATLLLDLLHRELPGAQVKAFAFKAIKPVFDLSPFQVCGRVEAGDRVRLWAVTASGEVTMDAWADLA
jgi:3-methylfumaryl-CoA hydratase